MDGLNASSLNARHAELSVIIGGHDATSFLRPYVTQFIYTDNATGKADEMQLELQNRDGSWNREWWPPKGTPVVATVNCHDWFTPGEMVRLACGSFTVDEVDYSGPPDKIGIKAVSASLTGGLRDSTHTRAWQQFTLQGVAKDVAEKNGLELVYEAEAFTFARQDQREESDLAFLHRLARERGCNLKVHNGKLILFAAALGDARPPLLTIPRAGSMFSPKRYSFKDKSSNTAYDGARVNYMNTEKKITHEGVYTTPQTPATQGSDPKMLELNRRVESSAEAMRVAQSSLREANKDTLTADIEVMGHPGLLAGLTVNLTGFGRFDGPYFIESSKHSLGNGYTTSCNLRKTLEY